MGGVVIEVTPQMREAFDDAAYPLGLSKPDLTLGLGAVLGAFVEKVEGSRGSALCDCDGVDSDPTNPVTGQVMDHHCDCRSVVTAAKLLGAYSETVHARQCDHGTEMDEFYERRRP